MAVGNYELFSNRYFVIEQCRDCAIPGYLIVRSLEQVVNVSGLSGPAAASLGTTLALAVSAVGQVIEPLKIYCAQFGEETSRLHFHVFPRTKDVTNEYLRERPEEGALIHGPVLFDWARSRFGNRQMTQEGKVLIERIREVLNHPASPSGRADA